MAIFADHRPRIPRTVWALGMVSLFMDLSSEIIHALLPLFLATTLGVSVATPAEHSLQRYTSL